ncbi:precorrin-3B synthase [Mesorhizobium sp. CN2-181]
MTGDGLLIRLSPASGGFSPKQLIGLCESAARHGNGIVEVTARGSCQFRGFSPASAECFAQDCDALDIVVRTGVPVETSPISGMDPLEIGDAGGLAERIRSGIDAQGLTGRLGPKVSVVIDGDGQVSLDSLAADVRLVASRYGDAVLWQVGLGGDAETATQLGWYDDDGAVDAALSVLADIAGQGHDARARDIAPSLTLSGPPSLIPPSVLPDISPSRGEIDSCDAAASPATSAISETRSASAISPLEGEMSGRTEGGAKDCNLIEASRISQPSGTWHLDSGFHVLGLKGTRQALPISMPFGHIDAAVLIDLARHAEALGVIDIRPAPHRTLLLICCSFEATKTLREQAQKRGYVTDPSDIRMTIAACPGAPACASGKIAARDIAEEVARSLPPNGHDLTIHISGCEKGCARQAPSDITLVGGEKGAGLVVGGTPRQVPLAYRSAGGLAKAITAVAEKLQGYPPSAGTKAAGKPPKTLSSAQLACLKAAFEQDGP